MPDYKKLYFNLYSNISNIIDQLQTLQIEAEEKYISDSETFKLIEFDDRDKSNN